MGSERTVHRLVSVDPERRRGVCLLCGPMAVIPRYESGTWRCGRHFRRLIRLRDSPYIAAKGDVCERCGFRPRASVPTRRASPRREPPEQRPVEP
jgi:hypothetical protein